VKKLACLLLLSFFFYINSNAQGCVAIRSNGGTCTMMGPDHKQNNAPASGWVLGINTRYFRSFRHFVGKDEQKQRIAQGTEVINHSYSTELGLTRMLNGRWSLAFFAPFISNTRSSLYEHDGKHRNHTHSFGVGDVRVAAYYWLVDPVRNTRFNVQAGLGIKLPTGDYRYQDYFYKNDSVKVLGPVDQSIQLGDGGTGITAEINAFYRATGHLNIYVNGYYLSNPREQNSVSTARGGTVSPSAVANGSDVMSVPDQYMARLGAQVAVNRFSFSGGLRIECVPSEDLIGGSNGFRRPGYVLSAEPVIAYKLKRTQLYVSVPYAVQRNRTQSVPDKIRTQKTGVYTKGDAAFADYSINIGAAFALN
jgi:hypothetical protein